MGRSIGDLSWPLTIDRFYHGHTYRRVGRSNSGKTTLIERVIPELVRAGYKVATVKHTGHGFDLDTEGKDSWRHKRAGASSVMVLSKGSMAMFADVSDQMKVEEVR